MINLHIIFAKTKNVIMKKIMSILMVAAMMLMPTMVRAQEAHSRKDWKPYGFAQFQCGVGTTFTNMNQSRLLSPTMTFGVGYMPIPELGIRFNMNGFWSKGGFRSTGDRYNYNYTTGDFDVLFNLTNIFSKDKMHLFNLYLVTGIGVNYAWGNDIGQLDLEDVTEDVSNMWGTGLKQKHNWGNNFRIGFAGDVRLTNHLSLGAEVDMNPYGDDFNAKFDGKYSRDWMLTAQLSLTYKFWKRGPKPAEPVRNYVPPTPKQPKVVKTKIRLDDISLEGQGNYRVGEYDPKKSTSSKTMLDNMARKIQTDLAPYIEEGGRVDIVFSGSADAIPVNGTIKYYGEDVYDIPVNVDGIPIAMTLTKAGGINNNEQLALARALKAMDYVYKTIPGLNSMKCKNYFNAKAATERGIEYRTVDVEFIFYGK